jgi:hypothetical protein
MPPKISQKPFGYAFLIVCVIVIAAKITVQAQDNPDPPPVITVWDNYQYLAGPDTMSLYVQICATDTVLHIYGNIPAHIYHFISTSNGEHWQLLADEHEYNISIGGSVKTYFGHDKFYTVYDASGPNLNDDFINFRASTNLGQSWFRSSHLRVDGIYGGPLDCNITGNGDTVFVIGQQGDGREYSQQLWRSYDAGNSWEHLFTQIRGYGTFHPGFEYDASSGVLHVATIAPFDSNSGNDDVYYWRSTDNGDTWSDSVLIGYGETGGGSGALAMRSDGLGNVAIVWGNVASLPQHTGEICRISHDQGLTWQPANKLGDGNGYANDVTISDTYVGVAWYKPGSNPTGYLYYNDSFNGGDSWTGVQEAARGDFLWSIGMVRVGNYSHIVFRVDPGARPGYIRYNPYTGIDDGPDNLIPSRIALLAYPNPFNSSTTLSINNSENAEISIFDITGKLIATLHARQGSVVWDATGFSSGVYFARVMDGGNSKSIKLVLLK